MPFRPVARWVPLATLLLAAIAGAADPDAPSPEAVLHGKLELSLDQAIEMGLENNLDVQVERHNPLIAERDVGVAWGAYDPELFAEYGYSATEVPNANVLAGTVLTKVSSTDGFGGFRGLLPFLGTEYNLQLDGARERTNVTIQVLSPELTSSWAVSVTQPLMRDLIWNEPWTRVKTTKLASAEVRENFRRAVMDTVRNIEGAYWDLIATEEQKRVAEKSLETARSLLEQTGTQYEVGVISKVEVTEAEAGVAAREFELIRETNTYDNAQDRLIDLVLGRGLRAESTLEVQPTDRPEDFIAYDIDVPEAVEMAFVHRPELAAKHKEIERRRVELKFAKNQRLPSLDAILSYGNEGLAGAQNRKFDPCRFVADDPTTIPDERAACEASPPMVPTTGFGDTFDDYFTEDAKQFVARAVLSVPIPNTSARNTVSKRELELRRSVTELRRLEQQIIVDVRRRARDLEAAQEGIESAERRRVAAEEQLRAERIRLEYGESTPFDVLQREEDLVEAESQKIGALRVYRTSATDLDRAQGTILRNRNIKIEEVSALR